MRKSKKSTLRVAFDSCVRLKFHGAEIFSDGSLPAIRDFDQSFQLFENNAAVRTTMGRLDVRITSKRLIPGETSTRAGLIAQAERGEA